MRNCFVSLAGTEIRVGAGFYRCTIALESIEGFSRAPDRLALRWRKNGIRLPGFALGWFVAKDGSTVFVAAGRARSAVRLQLRGDFDLVIGVDDPDRLIADIESQSARPGKSPSP